MSLSSSYSISHGKLPELFQKIREAQAPDQVTNELLKDWGFRSSNDRAMIPILKALGFLSPDGKPTSRYHDYRDHSRSSAVMADAIREAYKDIFLIKEHPTDADKNAIIGKFKSYHNVSDNVAKLMAANFYQLLSLADLNATVDADSKPQSEQPAGPEPDSNHYVRQEMPVRPSASLHYNIQVHLPATKDIEVYNAIFRSVREHLMND